MNENIELVELKKFKSDKREVFVDFKKRLIKWKNNTYRLKYINVDNKMYPYVIITKVKPLSEIRPLIRTINKPENKEELKFVEYLYNDHRYYLTGIGPEALKVIKDDNEEEEYLHYFETDGQGLLNILISSLNGQMILTTGD